MPRMPLLSLARFKHLARMRAALSTDETEEAARRDDESTAAENNGDNSGSATAAGERIHELKHISCAEARESAARSKAARHRCKTSTRAATAGAARRRAMRSNISCEISPRRDVQQTVAAKRRCYHRLFRRGLHIALPQNGP